MKKLVLLTLTIVMVITVNAQIEMNSSGNITLLDSNHEILIDRSGYYYAKAVIYPNTNQNLELGKSSRYLYRGFFRYLYVNGASITSSDERLKRNKKELDSSLEKIKKVKGYSYDLLNGDTIADFDQIGFMAQELLKVYPEMVHYDSVTELYGINYTAMIPVLLEAIKEQGEIIDDLAKQVTKNKGSQKSGEIETEIDYNNTLKQNSPNPFTQQTTINYTVVDNATNALLCIYDLNGTQLKCYEIIGTGNSSQVISGNELNAGMYLYSLIVDGELIDTKRMVLTE